MVSYYFGSRKGLLQDLVARVGDRLIEQVSGVSVGDARPDTAIEELVDHIWTQINRDPTPYAVYFGLVAESVSDQELRQSVNAIGDRYRDLIRYRIRSFPAHDSARLSEPSLVIAISTGIQGLALELLMRGDSEQLGDAVLDFKRWLRSVLGTQSGLEAGGERDSRPLSGPSG